MELSLFIFYTFIQRYYFYKYFMFVLLWVHGNTVSLCCRGLCEWMIYPKSTDTWKCDVLMVCYCFPLHYLSMDVSTLSSAAWMLHGSGSEHHKATQRSNSPQAIHCVLGASRCLPLSLPLTVIALELCNCPGWCRCFKAILCWLAVCLSAACLSSLLFISVRFGGITSDQPDRDTRL